MIEYENDRPLQVLFRVTGSVLPSTIPFGIFCFLIGLALSTAREYSSRIGFMIGDHLKDYIADRYNLKSIGLVIGMLLAVRTNIALSRWMQGLTEMQTMLSKWLDTFATLSGFFAGEVNRKAEDEQRILYFRVRIAHWFSIMSCLAFATLRARQLKSEVMDAVHIFELFGNGGVQSFNQVKKLGRSSSAILARKGSYIDADLKSNLYGFRLAVLSAPTSKELAQLQVAHDKVNCVYYWIIEAIIEEIRAGTLNAPPPIVSRVFQELSNGKLGFTQAHKVAMIPFPFPFAQMVNLLLIILYIFYPFYIEMFTLNRYLSPLLCFLVPIFLCGLTNVAVELEQPFGNDWNNLNIEDRHKDFLRALVGILQQPTTSPRNEQLLPERGIMSGCAQKQPHDDLGTPLRLEPVLRRYVSQLSLARHDLTCESTLINSHAVNTHSLEALGDVAVLDASVIVGTTSFDS